MNKGVYFMSAGRIIGWVLVPYVMVFLDWKRAHVLLKIYGSICAFFFIISVLVALTADEEKSTSKDEKEIVKKTEQTNKPLYPQNVLDQIKSLNSSSVEKSERFKEFEMSLINLNPTKSEVEEHLKIIKDAYQKMTYESVSKIDDETILKQIYSASIVDDFYSFDDPDNATGLFAFNYFQIAKDAYRGILQKEAYEINKSTMDKHYKNM
jgi:hypothetical protein